MELDGAAIGLDAGGDGAFYFRRGGRRRRLFGGGDGGRHGDGDGDRVPGSAASESPRPSGGPPMAGSAMHPGVNADAAEHR